MKDKLYLLLAIIFLSAGTSHAQMNPSGLAPGLAHPLQEEEPVQKYFLSKSLQQLDQEDQQGVSGVPFRIGYAIPVYKDLFQMGHWIEMKDGQKFFRVILSVPDAYALNVSFEDFYLPPNSQLFFYHPSLTEMYGGYNEADNHPSRMFPGPVIEGDHLVIEYFEPDASEVGGIPSLFVKDIMYYYRPIYESLKNQNIGASDDCHINVNCPEGDEWQDQKRGVARILLRVGNSAGWCSGSLINNTAQDGTPYFLTAEHCGSGASEADHNLWQFRFNFERPGCEDEGVPTSNTIPGSSLKAIGEMDGGSDMRLLRLNFTPPASFQPYYNGWDRSTVPAQRGVGIHHPSGDVKKISTFTSTVTNVSNPVISSTSMASNSAWNVFFVATETGHGPTQGGSSGSPLFNQSGHITGSLTGGSSNCSNPGGSNIYGKMSFHWESNDASDKGTDSTRQLRPWLDPIGTGQITLNGLDVYPIPKISSKKATVNEDLSVTLTWEKPVFDMPDNWYGHVASYSSVRHEVPERATRFSLHELPDVDTFYIRQLSHLFWQHPNFPWVSNTTFRFKIYEADATTMIYESPVLEASNFQTTFRPIVHVLPEEIPVVESFFVAVVPVQTGQPSSLSLRINDTVNSYFGTAGNWELIEEDGDFFELLINVYGSGLPPVHEADTTDTLKSATHQSVVYLRENQRLGLDYTEMLRSVNELSFGEYEPVLKSINNIISYNVYRDGVLIGSVDETDELLFLDNSDELVAGETYYYTITSLYNLNPDNPNSPVNESEMSDSLAVALVQLTVEDIPEDALSVFPNPVSGTLHVLLPLNDRHARLQLVNSLGQIVKDLQLSGEAQTSFDFSGAIPGIYYLMVYGDIQTTTRKIIVR